MASNALPRNTGTLSKLGLNMASGLKLLGTSLGITQVTAAQLEAQVAGMGSAESAYNLARAQAKEADGVVGAANETIFGWLLKARKVLVTYFGEAWSAQWAQAGFTSTSTAVPGTVGERFKLIGLLEAFLTANPTYENASPLVMVTAAEAKRLKDESTAANQAVWAADSAAKTKKADRETAIEALRGSMRVLIGILDDKFTPDDSRWADFGLNEPAADTTPATPIGVTVTLVDGPALLCQCNAVEKATRYRWRTRLVGAPDYTLAASSADPLVQIGNVTQGQEYELIVQAVNGSAQGLPSGAVTVTVPPPVQQTPRAAAGNGTRENGASSMAKPTLDNGTVHGNGLPQSRVIPS